jgi:uroporphyrinogen III methyltransferase / synthase
VKESSRSQERPVGRAVATGKVSLVGAGPGDPGLITVRGLELLSRAEVVLHDALAHPALLEACRGAEIHDVGKRYGEDAPAQQDINRWLIDLAKAGRHVVRLKGGDPLLFARGAEEILALVEAQVPFEIVPGISSPVATSAYAGISLTHRDLSSSVTFITGSDRAGKEWSPESWRKLATATDTICVLMGMRRIEQITAAIIEGGRDRQTPAAVIHWGARPEQRVVTSTLENIAYAAREAKVKNPSVIVIGDVVRLRETMRWYDKQPLFGKRMLLPRAAEQSRATAATIRERGAEAVVFPLIELSDPPDRDRLLRAARELGRYDWVLLTSVNGVERLFSALREIGLDARAFGAAKVGVIGPRTAAALVRYGVHADLVAEEFVGEGLARAVLDQSAAARRVLIVRALEAREALPEALRGAGIDVDVVAAYRTDPLPPERASELVKLFEQRAVEIVILTSSSIARSLLALLGDRRSELLAPVTVASIGPITTATLEELGVIPQVSADVYTVPGLLDALERYFAS